MNGFIQDYADSPDFVWWLLENGYIVADFDTAGGDIDNAYYPRIIYTKYVGFGSDGDNESNTIEKAKDVLIKTNNTILDMLFPDLGSLNGSLNGSEDGFGSVDGNGLLGLGLFPNLGRLLKPILKKLWWLIPLIIIILIFKLFKRKR